MSLGVSQADPFQVVAADEQQGSCSATFLTRVTLDGLSLHATVCGRALVTRSDAAIDRSGQPFLIVTLQDTSGSSIPARWWRYPYPPERRPLPGMECWFRATVDEYAGTRQLSIIEGRPVADANLSAYVRTTRTSLTMLQAQLEELIVELDPDLQALVRTVLQGVVYERYCEWPAAQRHHGSVRHGLLAHSLRVAAISRQLLHCVVPDAVGCDAQLVTAAALLHDIGKTETLPAIAGGAFPERAQYVDHVTLGVLMVRLAAASSQPPVAPSRLDALTHILLAHHGRKEWGAPVEPATLEAWLVHLADLVEARLWRWSGEEEGAESATTSETARALSS